MILCFNMLSLSHLHVGAYEDSLSLSPTNHNRASPLVANSERVGDVDGHVEYVVEMFPAIPFSFPKMAYLTTWIWDHPCVALPLHIWKGLGEWIGTLTLCFVLTTIDASPQQITLTSKPPGGN